MNDFVKKKVNQVIFVNRFVQHMQNNDVPGMKNNTKVLTNFHLEKNIWRLV